MKIHSLFSFDEKIEIPETKENKSNQPTNEPQKGRNQKEKWCYQKVADPKVHGSWF